MTNKTIFITRIKNEEDLKENNFKRLITAVCDGGINEENMYVVAKLKEGYRKVELDDKSDGKRNVNVQIVKDQNPTGPISINVALDKLKSEGKELDAFLVCSREIKVSSKDIEDLIKKIKEDKDHLLVAGYKFQLEDEELDNELQAYYRNGNLIAYQVPWNTCAIWNYQLFNEYVSKFDEITNENPFPQLSVSIDGVCIPTEYQGMEDGLAIAKAASCKEKGAEIKFALLKDNPLVWEINSDDSEIKRHRVKLARKETVMRSFMSVRDYSMRDLKNAKWDNEIISKVVH